MRKPFQLLKPLIWLLLLTCGCASAITPQTGIYWNPRKPGTALYVERQNGTIFVAVYGYSNSDSGPEFYVASGGIVPSIDADFIPYEGLFPLEGFAAPIYRVPNGWCLACPYAPIAPSQRVGVLRMIFVTRGGLFASINFDDGGTYPNPADQYGELLQRFNFSLGGVPTFPELFATLFTDVRGEWVFVDQSDPQRAPWRFNFTTREEGADLSEFALSNSVAFRDVARNAVLYCYVPSVEGLTTAQRQALPDIGCEVRQNGSALFWTKNEIWIDEFNGNLGAAPPRSAGIFRSSQRVVGRRISD